MHPQFPTSTLFSVPNSLILRDTNEVCIRRVPAELQPSPGDDDSFRFGVAGDYLATSAIAVSDSSHPRNPSVSW